mmetsp:Transcript_77904/g.167136  ORF Transcript_77904/g.167136 Transcript_77904/m.167136 type:complete len:205 (+) Transcript_77904:337-951(+)
MGDTMQYRKRQRRRPLGRRRRRAGGQIAPDRAGLSRDGVRAVLVSGHNDNAAQVRVPAYEASALPKQSYLGIAPKAWRQGEDGERCLHLGTSENGRCGAHGVACQNHLVAEFFVKRRRCVPPLLLQRGDEEKQIRRHQRQIHGVIILGAHKPSDDGIINSAWQGLAQVGVVLCEEAASVGEEEEIEANCIGPQLWTLETDLDAH